MSETEQFVHEIGPEVNIAIGEYFSIILSWLQSKKELPFCIVEVGTIRDTRLAGHEDGLSTFQIAKWIAQSGKVHQFFSLDLSPYHQRKCKLFLREHELEEFVHFGLGDGTRILEAMGQPIDFAYLDGGTNPQETLEQFYHVLRWKEEPALVVIDDTFDVRNASKGMLAMPIARLMGFPTASLMNRMGLIGCGLNFMELFALLPKEAQFRIEPDLDAGKWK